ncbi:MAG TPA: aromatic ring-hydroxylating dioxygenase subunit alpha [Puia sp.]|jgi:choline monooxygenase|nr:aromatic ring-hydroxylating dioxygenase subunit alpha [Puia sp.]
MQNFFVDENIAKAKTLDSSFYTDPEVFEKMKEKLFASSWQFIGDTGFVKQHGDVYPFTLLENYLGEPLMLTRDKEDHIHLLSNVCTHRGNIVVDKPCKTNNLRCKYHGRLFHLDGKFISMPEFSEVENFPTEGDNLKELPVFKWGNWLFASLNNTYSYDFFLKEMKQRVSWLKVHDYVFQPTLTREFSVKAHWALYCENYLEGFHIPFVHAGLNAVIDFSNYSTELFPCSSLQLGIAKQQEDCFDLPPFSPDYGKKIAAYYFFVFPNMMFNFYPWGLSVNVVQPVSLGQSKVTFYTYILNESKYNAGAGANLDSVELEDEEVVQNVQKGIRSRFYKNGRYSVTKEQGTHHFHRIISSLIQ